MKKPREKLFEENMPGNYMPANRDGCIVMGAFIGVALVAVLAGQLIGNWMDSPWPGLIGWAIFVFLIVRLVLFAKRHSK